jgi:hypothetical protein
MADDAQKVVLEAEDQVTPIVGKANASLDSMGDKAEKTGNKVVRINDQTRSSVQRLIASLEKQADVYGKTGVDRLIAQRDQLLQRYAKEPAAIDAITRSYEKMVAAARKAAEEEARLAAEAESGHGVNGRFAFFAAKDLIEGRTKNAIAEVGNVLSGLKGAPLLIGGIAAGIAAVGAAAIESARSLAEWGLQVKDVQLRTGFNAQQVEQFGFAAKATGQDVSIFERAMRGLSQAVDESSKEGDKARSALQKLGVNLYDTATGQVKPAAEILRSIGEGLDRLPAGFERDAAAMALFKRAGLEAIPVMVELKKNLELAGEGGPSQEEVDRAVELERQIAKAELAWSRFSRATKEVLASTVLVTVKVLGWAGKAYDMATTPWKLVLQSWFGGETSSADKEMAETKGYGYGYTESRTAHRQTVADIALNDRQVSAARASDKKNADLQAAERELQELQSQLKTGVLPSVNEPTLKAIDRQRSIIAGIKSGMEAAKTAAEELKAFRTEAAAFEKKGDESELDAIGKILYQRDLLLKQAEKVKASEAEIAAVRNAANTQVGRLLDIGEAHQDDRFQKLTADATEQQRKAEARAQSEEERLLEQNTRRFAKSFEDNVQRLRDAQRERDKLSSESFDIEAKHAGKVLELSSKNEGFSGELAALNQELTVKKAIRDQELQIKETHAYLYDIDDERHKNEIENLKDRYAMEEKILEVNKRETDEIKKTTEGLLHTLFTRPQDFGKQLGSTVKESLMKPIESGIAGIIASPVKSLVYGKDGTGGIAGMFSGLFGGKQDPVKLSTDLNTTATMQNSAVMAGLTAILVAGMGISSPAIASAGTSIYSPSISSPSSIISSIAAPATFGQGGGISYGSGSSDTGDDGGSAAPWSEQLPGGSSGRSGSVGIGGLGGILGGKGSSSGLAGTLGNLNSLKSKFWNTDIYTSSGNATTAAGIGGFKGGASAVLSSQGAAALYTAVGTPLALAGLTGSRRGTWGGVAEGTAGGALIGAGIGTMILPGIGTAIGAGIGAAAGFGIGVGEKLFGVKSLEQTAHDDIKQMYGVDIPVNSGIIKQIVDTAKSQYGGSISIAVRSPNVRQMVMLYAEGTGQKMPLSASTPRGGSLAEQNGILYQQASYQDGQAYTYASRLGTLGGLSSSAYPTQAGPNVASGGGPTYLSLNLSGADAATFMTGQFVTPQFVADQSIAAQNSSYGRTQQSANMQLPGLTIA